MRGLFFAKELPMPSRRQRKRQVLPEPATADITGLSHEGRGIARVEGKAVFVFNALPDETVHFEYLRGRGRFDEGQTLEILSASPQRVIPSCPHFGVCGGCALQHLDPAAQIAFKQQALLEQLQHVGGVVPEAVADPLTGPVWGYRRKARLGVKFVEKKDALLVGFRERNSNFLTEMAVCKVLHPAVGERITALRELIAGLAAARDIAQIEIAVGDNETALIFRNLAPLDEHDQQCLREFAQATGCQAWLQPGGLSTVTPLWPTHPAALCYHLPAEDVTIEFAATDFSQVNHDINPRMVAQALEWLDPQPNETVLELFCGLGNFTLPLARRARVTAVEGDEGLVARARANAQRNGLHDIAYFPANLMDPELTAPWLEAAYDKLLLDPPRSGAQEILRKMNWERISRVVYVSCNPATLARDAAILAEYGFRLQRVGVMDMFPHTTHVESMAWFERAGPKR